MLLLSFLTLTTLNVIRGLILHTVYLMLCELTNAPFIPYEIFIAFALAIQSFTYSPLSLSFEEKSLERDFINERIVFTNVVRIVASLLLLFLILFITKNVT